MKDAFALSDYFSKFELELKDLIAYLSTHKHSSRLKSVAEAIDAELVAVGRIHEVRWLSRSRVINGIVRNLPVHIQANLRDLQDSAATASALYRQVTSSPFVYGLGHLADILNTAAQLNKFFQRSFLHPSDVAPKLKAVTESLNAQFVLPDHPINGPMASKLADMVANGTLVLGTGTTNGDRNEDIGMLQEELHFMVSALIGCLDARLNTSNPILDAAMVFDPSSAPGSNMAGYGVVQIQVFSRAYERFGINEDGAASEWNVFKYEVAGSCARGKITTVEVLQKCISERRDYESIAKIP